MCDKDTVVMALKWYSVMCDKTSHVRCKHIFSQTSENTHLDRDSFLCCFVFASAYYMTVL